MFVLDTNTLIYFFKGEGRVAANLLAHAPQEIGVPAVVLYELEVGIARSTAPDKRRRQLKDFMDVVRLLPFGPKEAKAAARIRVALERLGTPIGPYDVLIAATAEAQQAVLVTRNRRKFERVPGLQVEDWYL